MDITDIRIRRVESEGKLKAYVTLTFDDCFAVHNLKIIKGQSGTFVAMPSRKTQTGEYKDIAHPINSEFRNQIQRQILAAYDKLAATPGAEEPLAEVEEARSRRGLTRFGLTLSRSLGRRQAVKPPVFGTGITQVRILPSQPYS